MPRHQLSGNLKGLAPSERKDLERLYRRPRQMDLIADDVARELYETAARLRRRLGLLITREGSIEEVFVGTKDILYLPELGRSRASANRLRRLRLIYTDLSRSDDASIPRDILTDLEKLRLDAVCGVKVKERTNALSVAWAHIAPAPVNVIVDKADSGEFDFREMIEHVEEELSWAAAEKPRSATVPTKPRVFLVGVYDKRVKTWEESFAELRELAKSAGVEIAGETIQRRTPDERTLLGKGKLEEVVLECLRADAEMLVFDGELSPSQWRVITNQTDLKVIDRSMLILDIFAQRASSADGRLQVELAQLKYSLPRLVEKDTGLSRLSGGIGGRGPGETKLEISRRRVRDKITELERRIDKLSEERAIKRARREENAVPLISIVGYTNVGKSTLFNRLTKAQVVAEDKLFATLDTTQRRMFLQSPIPGGEGISVVLSDTVGFIRDLPSELQNAFRATLEELSRARVLIHVLDASDPSIDLREQAVMGVLGELGVLEMPRIVVLNKIDRLSPEQIARLAEEYDGIPVSALTGEGLQRLGQEMFTRL